MITDGACGESGATLGLMSSGSGFKQRCSRNGGSRGGSVDRDELRVD